MRQRQKYKATKRQIIERRRKKKTHNERDRDRERERRNMKLDRARIQCRRQFKTDRQIEKSHFEFNQYSDLEALYKDNHCNLLLSQENFFPFLSFFYFFAQKKKVFIIIPVTQITISACSSLFDLSWLQ